MEALTQDALEPRTDPRAAVSSRRASLLRRVLSMLRIKHKQPQPLKTSLSFAEQQQPPPLPPLPPTLPPPLPLPPPPDQSSSTSSDSPPVIAGYLWKVRKSNSIATIADFEWSSANKWQKRWFETKGGYLVYYVGRRKRKVS
jgi:hypothetical protein